MAGKTHVGPEILSNGVPSNRDVAVTASGSLAPDLSTLYVVRSSEEVIQLDQRYHRNAGLSKAPGLVDVRRFHNLNPEVIVPGDLLRNGLWEDYQLAIGQNASGNPPESEGIIALGYARGPQYRLHNCILATSGAVSESLHFALLKKRPIVVTSGEGSFQGSRLAMSFSTSSTYNFSSSIKQIDVSEDERSPYFAIRTRTDVHIVTVNFSEEKEKAQLHLIVHFSAGLKNRPEACRLSIKTHSILATFSADGVFRVWSAKLQSHTRADFVLQHSIRGSDSSVSDLRICGSSRSQSADQMPYFLLTSKTKVEIVMISEQVVKTIFRAEINEILYATAPVKGSSQGGNDLYSILTSTRLMLVEFDIAKCFLLLKFVWKHYRSPKDRLALETFGSHEEPRLLLYSTSSGLCSLFGIKADSIGLSGMAPYRLDLGGHHSLTSILNCQISVPELPSTAGSIFGFFLLTRDDSVVSITCSTDPTTKIAVERAKRYIGPAVVSDDSAEDRPTLRGPDSIATLPDYITELNIDLSSMYHVIIDALYRELVQDQRVDAASRSPQGYYLKLAHELVGTSRMELCDIDQILESTVSVYHQQNHLAESTPGLCPRALKDAVSESDGHPTLEIEQLLRVWKGNRMRIQSKASQKIEAAVAQQSRRAAGQLTLSTAVFGDKVAADAGCVRLADLCPSVSSQQQSKALDIILDDWKLDQVPSQYNWRPFGKRATAAPPISIGTIQDIPQFSGTRDVPPQILSSQAAPPAISSTQNQFSMISERDLPMSMTQPVPGRFGGDRKQKKRKHAGF